MFNEGYDTILQAYRENTYAMNDASASIKKAHLGEDKNE